MLKVLSLLLVAALLAPFAHTEDAANVKTLRALLICGGCCHDYLKQQDIIKKGLEARANIEVTIAYEPDKGTKKLNPVYENADWAKGYDVIIHDECSADVKDIEIINRILKPHKDGLPAVHLHCAMHCYRSEGFPKATPWFELTGLATTGHGPQEPIAISYVDKEHPITKGLADWTTIKEELYNNLNVYPTAHALARGKQSIKQKDGTVKDAESMVTWTNEYGKTRVFGTTLGHNNATVEDARYMDLIARGTLWACDKLNEKYLKAAPAAK